MPQVFAGRMPIQKKAKSEVASIHATETATYIESNSQKMQRDDSQMIARRGPSPTADIRDTHPAGIFLLIISIAAVFLFPVYMEKLLPKFTTRFRVS